MARFADRLARRRSRPVDLRSSGKWVREKQLAEAALRKQRRQFHAVSVEAQNADTLVRESLPLRFRNSREYGLMAARSDHWRLPT
jgi:hypothetical protein